MDLLEETVVPEEARDIKQEAREFAAEHIEPNAAEYYERGEYPVDILEQGMEAGLVAQDIGEEYGGRGLSLQQVLAMAEEFYKADAGIALTLQLASFGAEMLEDHGNEEQKEEYLRPVAENEQLTGLAVSEPETGSDMAGMQTTAEKDGDEYVLNGEKYWIGNGVEADWVTVYAKTGDDPNNRYGNYSLFIVPTDTDGYDAEHIPEKMGFRASKQAHIVFDDCRVPEENVIGHEGAGFYMLAEFFNHGRVIVAGHGLGLAAAAIEEGWDFVHDREAFGKSVDEFQAVQHKLADMRMEFESARALTWRAADKVANQENAGFWAAMAKTKATEVSTQCAEKGMQLHGGRSVLTENRISRVYRDVRIPVIYEGANDIQRNLIYSQTPQ
ncbi:acyl-CoA dehydrogenase family protein [Halomicrobium sp. IBSBa]|uniref:Acyl-CoA dehydrogenase n=1 Tax=Halomicrobium mukohataei TaxID=57705 RepID=A0A847UG36_9EURY|nr:MULTISPECIES: acyl-CoA dehydrogenase family protein [Halomicrobium]MBO4248163.1 acyl-CoA dehydrogenase family protein [Halomicrobium sp. IBSBa]NLV10454.1 acyl-CoA dehydrogenase [Halomicrobium mukohataei]